MVILWPVREEEKISKLSSCLVAQTYFTSCDPKKKILGASLVLVLLAGSDALSL